MTAIAAATIKYGIPAVSKVGDLLFTVTNIEVPATAEEYLEGGVELLPAKLGLTDEAINGLTNVSRESAVGETATTSSLAGAIWSAPFIMKAKEVNESGKQVAEAMPCAVTIVAGKPFLRTFSIETAGIGKPFIEAKTATKAKLGLFQTTIYAFGK